MNSNQIANGIETLMQIDKQIEDSVEYPDEVRPEIILAKAINLNSRIALLNAAESVAMREAVIEAHQNGVMMDANQIAERLQKAGENLG